MKKPSPVSHQHHTGPSLAKWRALDVGEQIVAREESRLAVHLQRAPGQRLLLLGGWFPSHALGERWRRSAVLPSAVDTAITLATPHISMMIENEGDQVSEASSNIVNGVIVDGLCLPEQLPLKNEELDVIVAPHLAELCGDLSASVRDAARALEGGGWLMITGFMPASPVAAMVSRQPGSGWVRRRVGPHELRAVFAEEGFKVMLHECWSLGPECSEKRWRWMPDFLQHFLQGKSRSYMIIAKKIIVPLTPGVSDWFTTTRQAPRNMPAAGRASGAQFKSVSKVSP